MGMNLTTAAAAAVKTPWSGGPPPLAADARVYVTYRDGIHSAVRVCGDLRWEHMGLNDDIIAYRFSHMPEDDTRGA